MPCARVDLLFGHVENGRKNHPRLRVPLFRGDIGKDFRADGQHFVGAFRSAEMICVEPRVADDEAAIGGLGSDLESVFGTDVERQLADEKSDQTQDDEQPQRCDVTHAMSGQITDGDTARYEQVAQSAEDAAIEVPERFEHLLDRMTEVTQGVVRALAADMAVTADQCGRAVFAGGGRGVVGHALPGARRSTRLR